ncbi:hypothetical protein [Nocardiopsis rhodophaea]|uniref:hypothetical protein n=1 Tax=Nocardiopsis rhodophaea TaxID=280238 RepID=UPI0031E2E277
MKQQDMVDRWDEMQQGQEEWALVLDYLDGLVAQTMGRGWPEETARQLVGAVFYVNLVEGLRTT